MWNSSCEIIFFPTFRCLYWIFCNMYCNVKTKTLWMTRLQFEVELWSNRKPSSKYHLVQTQQRSGGYRTQAQVNSISNHWWGRTKRVWKVLKLIGWTYLCSITGYYWFSKDGQTIELDNITISHGGRYTCTADNGVGDPITEHLYITVLCKYSNKYKSVTAQIKTFRTKTSSWKSLSLSLY